MPPHVHPRSSQITTQPPPRSDRSEQATPDHPHTIPWIALDHGQAITPDDKEEHRQITPDHDQATPARAEVAAYHDHGNAQVTYSYPIPDLGVVFVVICGDFSVIGGGLGVIWADLAIFFFVIWRDRLAVSLGNPGDICKCSEVAQSDLGDLGLVWVVIWGAQGMDWVSWS